MQRGCERTFDESRANEELVNSEQNLAESVPMGRIDKLGKAQRVVVVVALGVAFLAVGSYLLSLGQPGIPLGWSGYAPFVAQNLGRPGWFDLLVWLALTLLWAVASIRLLRPQRHDDSD
jgi:hypothetical protein